MPPRTPNRLKVPHELPRIQYLDRADTASVTLRFKPLMSAPPLPKDTYKIKSTQRFENVHKFLRDQLGLEEGQGLYPYVGFSFAPALDEGVGGLWKSFAVNGVLVVGYCLQSAFG